MVFDQSAESSLNLCFRVYVGTLADRLTVMSDKYIAGSLFNTGGAARFLLDLCGPSGFSSNDQRANWRPIVKAVISESESMRSMLVRTFILSLILPLNPIP